MLKRILVGLLLAGSVFAQTPPPFNVQISQQPLPVVTNMFANYSGVVGQQTYFYFVVTNYAAGNSGPSIGARVNNAATSGSVAVGWTAPSSPVNYALTYDVIRLTNQTFPASGSCTNCLVASATSSVAITDTLATTRASYTLNPAFVPSVSTLAINNIDATLPLIYDTRGGSKYATEWGIGASLPTDCSQGDLFFRTGVALGSSLYGCTSGNVWTLIGGSSGGSCPSVGALGTVQASDGAGNCIAADVGLSVKVGTGTGNNVLGIGSMASNTTGSGNIAIGDGTLNSNTTGGNNIALGGNALNNIDVVSNNIAIGSAAMRFTSSASSSANIAIGPQAMQNSGASSSSIAIGVGAGLANAGNENIYIGDVAGTNQTTGLDNVFIGGHALSAGGGGSTNTVLGFSAMVGGAGSDNTIIGAGAGGAGDGNGNVFLGRSAGSAEIGSNKLYIDNTNTATPLIGGDFLARTITIGGSISASGSITSGIGTGIAGQDILLQGTVPVSFPTNSVTFYAPTSIPTAYQWVLPNSDAVGAIVSNGAGTPGILSIVGFSGTGNIAKVNSPTFITPILGAATANSVTSTTITASSSLVASLAAKLGFITGVTSQCIHVDTVGNVSGTGSDCGSGGGGGATTQLDNLSSVNINSALLAQTGIDVGSTTKPFRNLFISGGGTYGTNYLELTGTPTSTRIVTFPDATDTVAELAQAQTFTALQTYQTNTINTTIAGGPQIANNSAATNVQAQDSPCLLLTGHSWSGSASQAEDWCQKLVVFNGISYLQMYAREAGGSWSTRAIAIGGDGSMVIPATLTAQGNVIMSSGRALSLDFLQDRANTKGYFDSSVANFNWVNENRTTGNVNMGIRAKASQTADLLDFLAAGGTIVLSKFDVNGNLTIVPQKATTGQRFMCIDTNGLVSSSATACVGT